MKKSFTVIYFADGDKKDTLKQLKKQCPSAQLIRLQADFPDQRNAELGKALAKVKNDYFTVINEGDTLPEGLFERVDNAIGQVSQSGENALKQLRTLCPTAQLAKDQNGVLGSEQQEPSPNA